MTDFITERDLAQIYKEDFVPMSKELIEGLQIDNYVWVQQFAPDTSITDFLAMNLRIIGKDVPREIKARLPKYRSEINHSETYVSDEQLIEIYLKELRERRNAD